MSLPNELTAEEQAMFGAHGVTFDGPPADAPAPEPAPAPAPAPEPAPPFTPPVTDPVVPPIADPNTPVAPADPNAPVAPVAAPPPGYVPHGALHQERVRAAEANQRAATAVARLNALIEAQAAQRAPVEMPDILERPAEYMQTLEERLSAFEAQQQEANYNSRVDGTIEQDERQFASYTPDYPAAAEHYVRSRATELLQFNQDPGQVQRILAEETRQIAAQSWQRGVPAAQAIYMLAQARGYQPGAGSTAPVAPQAPAPAAPPAPAAQATPQSTLAAIGAGQAASRSLTPAAGAGGAAPINGEALVNMTDEQFEAYLKLGTREGTDRFAAIAGR